MTEQEMKLEARLTAIEYVLANTVANIYGLARFTKDDISRVNKNAEFVLGRETLGGPDPAQSDMWMAEIESAVLKIQTAASEMWEDKVQKAKSRG